MGRKVRTASNLRSNLYVLGIAESGGGKDHARKVIKEVFFQAGLADHLGGERIASGAGLITALTRQPASLFQIDEFGKFTANVADKRRAPKHLSEIWDLFTELATSAGTTFFGAEYADQRDRPRQDIVEPCASIHGVSAPGPFWDALKSGSLQDGSLARFLVFRSEDDIPDRNRRPEPSVIFRGVARGHPGGGCRRRRSGARQSGWRRCAWREARSGDRLRWTPRRSLSSMRSTGR